MDSQKSNISELSNEKCQINEDWGCFVVHSNWGERKKQRIKETKKKMAYTLDISKYEKTI